MTETHTPKPSYSQKLRDPRWQRKRLQILERDDWTCQSCRETQIELQVHHLVYGRRDPWDYPDDCYQTLCRDCHEKRQELTDKIVDALRMSLKNVPTERVEKVALRLMSAAMDEMGKGGE